MSNLSLSFAMAAEPYFYADEGKYDKRIKRVYVEGALDKKFFSNIFISNYIKCRSVKEAEAIEKWFHIDSSKKEIIANLRRIAGDSVYGIVDRDYKEYEILPNIFCTDTRDIESLIAFTDKDIYKRLGTNIKASDVKTALVMAYQLGYAKQHLRLWSGHDSGWFSDLLDGVEKCYNNESELSIDQLRKHIKKISPDNYPSNADIAQFQAKHKAWNQSLDSLDFSELNSTWDYIGGHDFSYFLSIVSEEANQKYYGILHGMEHGLIDVYNYECFKSTKLYELLKKAELV